MEQEELNYLEINRTSWNKRTASHVSSEFYDVEGFIKGKTSLNSIELDMLGNLEDKSVLHLQCHFGQDTISLSRMGARAMGVDLSDKAIDEGKKLAARCHQETDFICCDVYDLVNHLDEKFDVVFTTYGTIGWLPDMNRWAEVVASFLKTGGELIFVEFHPVVWMFDDDFKKIKYDYFNTNVIVETESGTYADREADFEAEYVSWNHPISEVVNALINNGLEILSLDEFDYSPYNCFKNMEEVEESKFRIKHLNKRMPMVYAIKALKK